MANEPQFLERRFTAVNLSAITPPSDASADSGTLRDHIGRLKGAIPRITGKTNWNDVPDYSMLQLRDQILANANLKRVRVASTANIDLTTGGLLTVDGVTVSAGDRVLVKDQSTASQNGIYGAASGQWSRVQDANQSEEFGGGLSVYVQAGSTQNDAMYSLTTDDPITLGSTSLVFKRYPNASPAKPDADVATTANITLSGLQTVDGVALSAGQRVLVKNQSTSSQNGIYVVSSGTWQRADDASQAKDFRYGQTVRVRQGTQAAVYFLSSTTVVTVDTTAIAYTAQTTSAAHTFWGTQHTDIDTTDTPVDGDVVTYNSSTSKWVASPPHLGNYLEGLKFTWDSATTLGVEVGAAYVQSVGNVIRLNSRATLTFSGMTTNAIQYIYLTSSGTIVSSTTAPAAPYFGDWARSMTGDTTRRYVGEVVAASATTIYQFDHFPSLNLVRYPLAVGFGNSRVVTNGLVTTETNITCTPVPITSRMVELSVSHAHSGSLRFGYPGDGVALTSDDDSLTYVNQSHSTGTFVNRVLMISVDSTQRFSYRFSSAPTASNGAYIDVRGYYNRR